MFFSFVCVHICNTLDLHSCVRKPIFTCFSHSIISLQYFQMDRMTVDIFLIIVTLVAIINDILY